MLRVEFGGMRFKLAEVATELEAAQRVDQSFQI